MLVARVALVAVGTLASPTLAAAHVQEGSAQLQRPPKPEGDEAAALAWLEEPGVREALQQLPPAAWAGLQGHVRSALEREARAGAAWPRGREELRRLGGSPAATPETAESSGGGTQAAEHHTHEALAYLTCCFVLGIATYHGLSRSRAVPLPYTVALFLEGVLLGVAHVKSEGKHWQTLSNSIEMWVAIDYHVLLYTFLPCLLFGDSLSLNWSLFKRCFWQSVLLAGPGVLVSVGLTALVARHLLPYGWDWNTCLTFGSILSATDPVAVVSLLKDMGCSRILTMQIAGESFLNDGVAILAWTLCFKAMRGSPFRVDDAIFTFFRLALGGVAFGWLLGNITLSWLLRASDKMRHEDHVIQISLTLACAYFTFFFSENDLHLSGVLAVVFAGLCLSRAAWPLFTDYKGLITVWHTIEFIGNTVVFFLAGTITGKIMASHTSGLSGSDYGWLAVVYFFVLVTRAFVIALFYPAMKRIGAGCNWKDAVIISWGGLRGAVGLALAIAVDNTEGVDRSVGTQFVFHVSGVAGLSLLINATTSAPLLRHLGMTCRHEAHHEMVADLRKTLVSLTKWSYVALASTNKFKSHDRDVIRTLIPALRAYETTTHCAALGGEIIRAMHDGNREVTELAEQMEGPAAPNPSSSSSVSMAGASMELGHHAEAESATVDEEMSWTSKSRTSLGSLRASSMPNQPLSQALPPNNLEDRSESLGCKRQVGSQSNFSPSDDDEALDYDSDATNCTQDQLPKRRESMHKRTSAGQSSADTRESFSGTRMERRSSLNIVALDVVESVRHMISSRSTPSLRSSLHGDQRQRRFDEMVDGLFLQTEREFFLGVLQATYWSFLQEGFMPAQSQATTALLRSVDVARMECHLPLSDGAALLRSLVHHPMAHCNALGWVWRRLLHFVDGDNIGFMLVPCRQRHNVFDLFALVSFMDAHKQARKVISKFRTEEGSELELARGMVLDESKLETEAVKKFLHENEIDSKIIRVRTKQLAFKLLLQQEAKVNEWLRQGAVDATDTEELLKEVHTDYSRVLRPWREFAVQRPSKEATPHRVSMDCGNNSSLNADALGELFTARVGTGNQASTAADRSLAAYASTCVHTAGGQEKATPVQRLKDWLQSSSPVVPCNN